MPGTEQQRRFFAWVKHNPDQARAEGKYPTGMSDQQMQDFITGPTRQRKSGAPKPPSAPRRKFYGEK